MRSAVCVMRYAYAVCCRTSGPMGMPDDTEQMVPMNLVMRVLKRSRLGMWLPLRYAMTSVTPPPAAPGAQYCTCGLHEDGWSAASAPRHHQLLRAGGVLTPWTSGGLKLAVFSQWCCKPSLMQLGDGGSKAWCRLTHLPYWWPAPRGRCRTASTTGRHTELPVTCCRCSRQPPHCHPQG